MSRSASNASAARKLFTCRVACPPPRTSTRTASAGTYAGSNARSAPAARIANLPAPRADPTPSAPPGPRHHGLGPHGQVGELAPLGEHVVPPLQVERPPAHLHRARAGEREDG